MQGGGSWVQQKNPSKPQKQVVTVGPQPVRRLDYGPSDCRRGLPASHFLLRDGPAHVCGAFFSPVDFFFDRHDAFYRLKAREIEARQCTNAADVAVTTQMLQANIDGTCAKRPTYKQLQQFLRSELGFFCFF